MKMFATAAIAAMGATLSGCATVFEGATQTVSVSSPPVRGARCALFTESAYRDVITPGSVTLPRSRKDLTVVCTKNGFKDTRMTVGSHFNFVTFGNFVVGGVTGLVVDASTGANDSYPGEIEVPMEPTMRTPMFGYSGVPTS